MEKSRKIKIMSIAALVLAVAALTLGFASFSKIMKISSSANVSLPTEENLNLTLYGFVNSTEVNKFYEEKKLDFSLWSKDKIYAWDPINEKFNYDYNAIIDNSNFTININSLKFINPGEQYFYMAAIQNDSDYGVYVYLSDESRANYSGHLNATCVADEKDNVSEGLLERACQNIKLIIASGDLQDDNQTYKFLNGTYKLAAGSYMYFYFLVSYSGSDRVDGNFSVEFDPIEIEFDVMAHQYPESYLLEEDA